MGGWPGRAKCFVIRTPEGAWAFSAQFFILSGPPGSGKTTFLQRCASKFEEKGIKVKGVLAPDAGVVNGRRGRRQLQLLSSSEVLPFQLNDGNPGDPEGLEPGGLKAGSEDHKDVAETDCVKIGNFLFDSRAFDLAGKELQKCRDGQGPEGYAPWIFIDEIGPLELRRKEGLEPAVGNLLRAAKLGELGPPQSRFIIVVRPSLRDQMVETYFGTSEAEASAMGSGLFDFGPEAHAAAIVDINPAEDPDALIARLAQLPPLL